MAEKAGFEGEGEVEFRSPGKIRDARDEGFQETCRTCQDSNKIPKRHERDNEICVRPASSLPLLPACLVDLREGGLPFFGKRPMACVVVG